jgi:4-hydroxy-tetrahydrodipicolinate synthase
MGHECDWSGVFPAVTTQFREDGSFALDIDATAMVIEGLIRDRVSGLIICGTVGEGCSLTRAEKVSREANVPVHRLSEWRDRGLL